MENTSIGFILGIVWFIPFCIFLLWVVSEMAKKRGRSVTNWILLSLFLVTPLLVIPILFFLGNNEDIYIERTGKKLNKKLTEENDTEENDTEENSISKFPISSHVIELKTKEQFRIIGIKEDKYVCTYWNGLDRKRYFSEDEIELYSVYTESH